ncbi:phytoene/squalene synthase family protein [Ramlibacter albus]|uniref:Squalene/phytoene synthase family protein n=1 Tax=Ramlibacter albus TaxID=2079448 RepID=A0A923S580_9BURK|nr:phytoene/squalene synthase family protein [Ramlibacter albus]MBC5768290.1 squalene/phytoene synthase family protein [Ramlibacter albus]
MPLQPLLREVSRSFYLSIRLLPDELRGSVGLAYLLARATDTIADTAAALPDERRRLLTAVGDAIAAGWSTAEVDLQAFIASQGNDAERSLMERLDELLAALLQQDAADQADIRTVLGHIVRGQLLDIDRPTLPDAKALDEYTYLVAGSVGEFWTDICARHVPQFATLPMQDMRALGRSFGCGLQLVNILRDAGEDRRMGRCYLPGDEVAHWGVEAVWMQWQAKAAKAMFDGIIYAQAVNPPRIRAAVALPALIGRSTLNRLRRAGPRALHKRVKVPRAEVHWLLLRMALGRASIKTLRREWENRAR